MPPTVKAVTTCGGISCGGLVLAKIQAPCVVCIRPAQWTSCCTEETWAKVTLTISLPGNDKTAKEYIVHALAKSEADDRNFIVQKNNGTRFTAWFVTPYYQWVDLMEAEFEEIGDGRVKATFTSGSTSMVPSSCIGAPLFGCLIGLVCPCILVKDGDGKNLQHIMAIKDLFEDDGMKVEHEVHVWGSADKSDPRYAPTKMTMEGRVESNGMV